MFFWNKICGLIAIFFILCNSSVAQNHNKPHFLTNNFSFSKSYSIQKVEIFSLKKEEFQSSKISFLYPRKLVPQTVPANFSTCEYGFFCKEELKMEKVTKLPIRIRLGSLQQCNYYEGKE